MARFQFEIVIGFHVVKAFTDLSLLFQIIMPLRSFRVLTKDRMKVKLRVILATISMCKKFLKFIFLERTTRIRKFDRMLKMVN